MTSAPARRSSIDLPLALAVGLILAGAGSLLARDVVPPIAALGLGGLGMAILLLTRPDLATLLAIGLIFSNAAVIGARLYGLPYAVPALLPALFGLPLAHRLLFRREPIVFPLPARFFLAFLAVQFVSAALSRDPGRATDELVLVTTEGLILYLLIVNTVRTPRLLIASIAVLVSVGAVLASLSLIQQLTGSFDSTFLGFAQLEAPPPGADPTDIDPGALNRAAGPIGEQNFYAQMLLALVPLGVALAVIAPERRFKVALLVMTVLIGGGMAMTFSRGAAVGAAVVVVAIVLTGLLPKRALIAAALGGVVMFAAFPQYLERLTSLQAIGGATQAGGATDPVIQQRTNDVLAAALVFVDHPVLGVGPGLFSSYYQEYARRVGGLPGQRDYAAHSLYAEIAAETGVLGLVAFAGIIISTALMLERVRRTSDRPAHRAIATAMLLVLLAYLTTGLFLHISYHRYIWMFLALAAAAGSVLTPAPTSRLARTTARPDRRPGVVRQRRAWPKRRGPARPLPG